jgi:hypothetical protein
MEFRIEGNDDAPAEEGNANARLIAAAPDLLEAAEVFATLWEDAESISYPLKVRFRKACMIAQEAIAKAHRGEE